MISKELETLRKVQEEMIEIQNQIWAISGEQLSFCFQHSCSSKLQSGFTFSSTGEF